jgi:hypothetical protein
VESLVVTQTKGGYARNDSIDETALGFNSQLSDVLEDVKSASECLNKIICYTGPTFQSITCPRRCPPIGEPTDTIVIFLTISRCRFDHSGARSSITFSCVN